MKEVLLFKIKDNYYAIEVSNIQEVINLDKEISKIPNSSNEVIGLLLHRKKALPIFDLKKIFNNEYSETANKKIIVLDIVKDNGGFLIDEVLQVLKVEGKDLMELPNGLGWAEESMFKFNNHLCHLLSKERLLSYFNDNDEAFKETT